MTQNTLRLGDEGSLYFEYDTPGARGQTFVFVNALTGNTEMWQAAIGPSLRAAGYGTLAYNFRGQAKSAFTPGLALDERVIAQDLGRLLAEIAPPRPIVVGLSIGGLYAVRALLNGSPMTGLVLVNTLRRPRPRLEWINAAMVRAAALGGTRLVMDMYLPVLVGEERLQEVRGSALLDAPYEPLAPADGHLNLLMHGVATDWNVPWKRVTVPTLVMTGLLDRLFYDRADVAALVSRLPDARQVELEDAGHLIPVERPVAFVRHLQQFAEAL